ncbi:hypothetical protein, partial [Porphyromonas gulae]|uniref:hypothetical protein n=1 Tax=Porphyromonas gulae TaxID=111105 RepID=UPI001F246CDA
QRQTILTEEIVQSCSEYRLSQKASKHLMRLPWPQILALTETILLGYLKDCKSQLLFFMSDDIEVFINDK